MISHDATTPRRLEPGGHRPRYPSPNLITWQSSEKDVEDLFIKFGKVTEARVATDRETGSSRGFGFVTFEDPRDADDAIRQLDNSEFMVSDSAESASAASARAAYITSFLVIPCRRTPLQT